MNISNKIIKPMITEKSMALADARKYVFQVSKDTTKGGIANELKKLYNVDVIDAQSLILPGKKRRIAKTPRFRKTAERKKMIVTLKEGQKLDFLPKEK
jgi:large subunit ribosomal protein L23